MQRTVPQQATIRNGKKIFPGWNTMRTAKLPSARSARFWGKSLQRTGGVLVTKPFTNWKKIVEKMKAHEKSDLHSQANLAALPAEGVLRVGSIMQQLQNVNRQERIRNRAAIKSLVCCTHLLT